MPLQLEPSTRWSDIDYRYFVHPRRKTPEDFPILVAAYLPFNGGQIDGDSFLGVLQMIYDAGCVPVVNADTGFCFHLTAEQKKAIVAQVRKWFPGKQLVVGVTPGAGASTFDAGAYKRAIDDIQGPNTLIMVMISKGLTALTGDKLIAAYAAIDNLQPGQGIAHELTDSFVPFGRAFSPYEMRGILRLDSFGGLKTSVLAGIAVAPRVTVLRQSELGHKLLYSGVDWQVREAYEQAGGILMGAACLFPTVFAKLLELRRKVDEEARLGPVYDQLQASVQCIVTSQFLPFRVDGRIDVSAYRHFTAVWLKSLGVIESAEPAPPLGEVRQKLRGGDVDAAVASARLVLEETLRGLREPLEDCGLGGSLEDWLPEAAR